MPRKGLTVEFCDGQNQFKVPFIMYADFELILEPIQGPNPEPTGPYTSNGYQVLNIWFTANLHTERLKID